MSETKTTKILKCSCKHKYQDDFYGVGQRVMNKATKTGDYTCTVCGTSHKLGVKP